MIELTPSCMMKVTPIYLAMQAEGREWGTCFEGSIEKFDYVFTDAMTLLIKKKKPYGYLTRLY
jgi:hypothetical protein